MSYLFSQNSGANKLRDRITGKVVSNKQELINLIEELRNFIIASKDDYIISPEDITEIIQDFDTILSDGFVTSVELDDLGEHLAQLLIDGGLAACDRATILTQFLEERDTPDRKSKLEGEVIIQVPCTANYSGFRRIY